MTCQFIDMLKQPEVLCLSTKNFVIHCLNTYRTIFLFNSRLTIEVKGHIDTQTFNVSSLA